MPTLLTLLLAAFLATPLAASAETLLRVQGSNTIGASLGPALIEGMLQAHGLQQILRRPGERANEQRISALDSRGQSLLVTLAAHGSSTGFAALQQGTADLAASSRPVSDTELVALQRLGDMKSAEGEHVIAIDGVAVIVHPQNPLRQLNTAQLAQLFAGEITDWQALGGSGPVHLYARDRQSGTWETFRDLVLAPRDKPLAASAQRYESSEQLSDAVSQDPQGIGFIGLPYVRAARALAIADGDGRAMAPTASLIATEDYPLSRRLYLYTPTEQPEPWATELARFAESDQGQAIVAAQGFVAQTVQAMDVQPAALLPPEYQALARQAQRLSVNFRFAEGSASLDNKAQTDLRRVLDYIARHGKQFRQVSLVGFGDAKDDPARALLLSKLRAMAVRRELARGGVVFRDILGLGAQLPVAANDLDEGRIKNRRVEVWVY